MKCSVTRSGKLVSRVRSTSSRGEELRFNSWSSNPLEKSGCEPTASPVSISAATGRNKSQHLLVQATRKACCSRTNLHKESVEEDWEPAPSAKHSARNWRNALTRRREALCRNQWNFTVYEYMTQIQIMQIQIIRVWVRLVVCTGTTLFCKLYYIKQKAM